jgi:hypothetical protein
MSQPCRARRAAPVVGPYARRGRYRLPPSSPSSAVRERAQFLTTLGSDWQVALAGSTTSSLRAQQASAAIPRSANLETDMVASLDSYDNGLTGKRGAFTGANGMSRLLEGVSESEDARFAEGDTQERQTDGRPRPVNPAGRSVRKPRQVARCSWRELGGAPRVGSSSARPGRRARSDRRSRRDSPSSSLPRSCRASRQDVVRTAT